MLVLMRRIGETLMIGDHIAVTVLGVRGDEVRFAVSAPKALLGETRGQRQLHVGECLRIGDDITVTVLSVQGRQVRLGTTAPRAVAVHREEVYRRVQAQADAQREGQPAWT